MSQTFRTPPRQIGFKPAAPAAPRLNQVQAAPNAGVEAKIRQQMLQLQQLQAKLRIQEERLTQLKIPSARQTLEAQIQQMRKEFASLHQSLLQLRGQLRLDRLKPMLASEADTLSEFQHQVTEIHALYKVQQPLPQRLLPQLEAWLTALNNLLEKMTLKLNLDENAGEELTAFLVDLGRELWQGEFELMKRWSDHWLGILLPEKIQTIDFQAPSIPATKAETKPESDLEVLSFEHQGPLELSFDLSNRKSVVRNQMGITLNQPKKSYQEYLEVGFTAIDQTVASQFENRQPLYGAVEAFLEAVSLDRSRYEAYFGLGYLYSLVKDANHALYFLDLAWRISGDQAIQEMMDRVRSACSISI